MSGLGALIWIVVLCLGAAWSLLAWAAHAIVTWSGWRALDLTAWSESLDQMQIPAWAQAFVPPQAAELLKSLLAQWGPGLRETVLGMPDLGAWLGSAVMVVWALGMAALAGSGLIGMIALRALRARLAFPHGSGATRRNLRSPSG
jgi:hypothetical protein